MTSAAIVVGSGPNGLAAAIALAQAGHAVTVLEAAAEIGGGARTSATLTLPGFRHDTCSAVHPMAIASPYLKSLALAEHGLRWLVPPLACAHPLDGGRAAFLGPIDAMADDLGADGRAYKALMAPFIARADDLLHDALGPLGIPRNPLLFARFGLSALLPAATLARRRFRGDAARALFAGVAAHTCLPLEAAATSAIGLMLSLVGHAYGWPVPEGGAGAISAALAAKLRSLGGRIETGRRVATLAELPPKTLVLLDMTPRQLLAFAGDQLPAGYARRLARFRYGPGVFKVDWALSGPIPWTAPACRATATVHVGGSLDEISVSEGAPARGEHAERPYVLVTQPSVIDPTRAPPGQHAAWGYCHVPNGSAVDMTARIEAQVERFAPGFRDLIRARHTEDCAALTARNENYVGGDINGGAVDLRQVFIRPVSALNPYATPLPGVFLCSASTPPGPGVHGMSGFHAAQAALRSRF